MYDNSEETSKGVDGWTKHMSSISTVGTWVGEDVILAAANYLSRPIYVYTAAESSSPLIYSPSKCLHEFISVAFYEPGHYRAVKMSTMSVTGLSASPSSHQFNTCTSGLNE